MADLAATAATEEGTEPDYDGVITHITRLKACNDEILSTLKHNTELLNDILKTLAPLRSSDMGGLKSTSHGSGRKLVETTELLEMILLRLRRKDILSAQRVNRRFRFVIAKSRLLQHKLFFTSQPPSSNPAQARINPLLSKKPILARLPVYLDLDSRRLAYVHRKGRVRVLCRSAKLEVDHETHETWLNLIFKANHPKFSSDQDRVLEVPLGIGTWRSMYISQGTVGVKWKVTVYDRRLSYRELSGVLNGEYVLDRLLEELAAASVDVS
jgi:hypothetical protein